MSLEDEKNFVTIKTNFYEEICCEYCNNVIHNHFDCPACQKSYAGTSQYIYFEPNDEFECEECDQKFIYVGDGLVIMVS